MKITRGQLALIHVSKSKIGMTEEEYRELLGSFGVKSSKMLSPGQCDEIMKHFYKCGFTHQIKMGDQLLDMQRNKQEIFGQIKSTLRLMGLPWAYARKIGERKYRIRVLNDCNAKQLFAVLQALRKQRQREVRREAA